MGWKKVATTTTGTAVGAGIGTVTLGPLFAGIGAAIGGPAAPITGAVGYGVGCLVTSIFGCVSGKKVGDAVDED